MRFPFFEVVQNALDDGLVFLELDERLVEALLQSQSVNNGRLHNLPQTGYSHLNLKRRVQKCVVARLNVAQLLFDDALDSGMRRCVATDLSLAFTSDVVHSSLIRIDFRQEILQIEIDNN